MAAVDVTISGVLFDKVNRTTQNVVLIGEATLTGLGIGGGPMPPGPGRPPGSGGGPVDPGYGYPERPVDPGYGYPIGGLPHPSHPIALPGDPWWPPEAPKPPQLPPPGSPPVMIPGTQPVHPITPPSAIVVDYPGVGKVLVPMPLPPA